MKFLAINPQIATISHAKYMHMLACVYILV